MTSSDDDLPFGPLGTPIIRCIGETLGRGLETMVRALMPDHEPGPDRNLWCETIAARLADTIPSIYASITQTAVSDQLRKRGVEVKQVREQARNVRAGCERSAVEQAARPVGAGA